MTSREAHAAGARRRSARSAGAYHTATNAAAVEGGRLAAGYPGTAGAGVLRECCGCGAGKFGFLCTGGLGEEIQCSHRRQSKSLGDAGDGLGGSAGIDGRVQCRYVCSTASAELARDVCPAAAAWLRDQAASCICARACLCCWLTRGAWPADVMQRTIHMV